MNAINWIMQARFDGSVFLPFHVCYDLGGHGDVDARQSIGLPRRETNWKRFKDSSVGQDE